METVIVALGANLGDRLQSFRKAASFLETISTIPLIKASIWESEPVGPARYTFYNSAVKMTTGFSPGELLFELKQFEKRTGRTKTVQQGPRVLDLDIIRYGNLVIEADTLIIPHPEYKNRLFVLLPMMEIDPEWRDPTSGKPIQKMAAEAPDIEIRQTDISW